MGHIADTPGVNPVQNTSAALIATNPVFLKGQAIIETDTNRGKIGDGESTYTQLSYAEWGYEIVEAAGTNTYTGDFSKPFFIAYFPMMRIRVRFANANTGAATINLNGLGAKSIVKNVSTALASGDILAGGIYHLIYDGTNFQITFSGGGETGVSGSGATNQVTYWSSATTIAGDTGFTFDPTNNHVGIGATYLSNVGVYITENLDNNGEVGIYGAFNFSATANNSTVYGGIGQLFNAGGNTGHIIIGFAGRGENTSASGSVTELIGLRAEVGTDEPAGGAVIDAYGLDVEISGSFYRATRATGVNIPNMGALGTTVYGIRIASQSGATTNWAIASDGGNSYHVGNLRVGSTTAAVNKLDVTGSSYISGHLAVGSTASVNTDRVVNIIELVGTTSDFYGLFIDVSAGADLGATNTLYGAKIKSSSILGDGAIPNVIGLDVIASHEQGGLYITTSLIGARFQNTSIAGGFGITTSKVISVLAPSFATTADPTTHTGIEIANQGNAGTTTSYGFRILAQSGSTTNWGIAADGSTTDHYIQGMLRIGSTIAPTNQLDVTGTGAISTSLTCPIIIGSTSASGTLTLRATSSGTDGAIIFQSDPTTERVRILSTGEVLINATTALAGEILSIQKNSNAGNYAVISNTTSGTASYCGYFTNNSAGFATNYMLLGTFSAGWTTVGMSVAATHVLRATTLPLSIGTDSSTNLRFWTNNVERAFISNLGSKVMGIAALATNATDGFLYIPTCAGTPTGVPTAHTGTVAMIFDTTNNKLYIYDGSWLGGTTPGAFT